MIDAPGNTKSIFSAGLAGWHCPQLQPSAFSTSPPTSGSHAQQPLSGWTHVPSQELSRGTQHPDRCHRDTKRWKTQLILDSYWDTGLTYKMLGCVTNKRRAIRRESKVRGAGAPLEKRVQAGWQKGHQRQTANRPHGYSPLSTTLAQSLFHWISELWPKRVKVNSPKTEVFPLSHAGLSTKDNPSLLVKL